MSKRKGFLVDVALCVYCRKRPVHADYTCRVCREWIQQNDGKLPGPAPFPPKPKSQKVKQPTLFGGEG